MSLLLIIPTESPTILQVLQTFKGNLELILGIERSWVIQDFDS